MRKLQCEYLPHLRGHARPIGQHDPGVLALCERFARQAVLACYRGLTGREDTSVKDGPRNCFPIRMRCAEGVGVSRLGAASLLEFRFEIDQLYVALPELLAYGALLIEYRCPESVC